MRILLVILSVAFLYFPFMGQDMTVPMCSTGVPDSTWEDWFSSKVKEYKRIRATSRTDLQYTIPVIVHIIHNETNVVSENISWDQVNSQLIVLNTDFSASNTEELSLTPDPWQDDLGGDVGIQFCLAKVDNNGVLLEEEGIHRINWEDQEWANFDSLNTSELRAFFDNTVMPETLWDPSEYLNIWVYGSTNRENWGLFPLGIDPWGDVGEDDIEDESRSGIVVWNKVFGTIGTVIDNDYRFDKGRTTTHEVGHWLGLRHISGDIFCGNDHCGDTPQQLYHNFGCPVYPHNQWPWDYPDACFGSFHGEMFMNYMDYTNDTCKYMFTADQAERMQTAMMFGTYRDSLQYSTACQEPCADLIVKDQSVSPAYCIAGDSIAVTFKEKNLGGALADSNHVSFHLSPNNILTPGQNGDVYIGEYLVNQNIEPLTQTEQLSTYLLIPESTNPGQYYLFFSADGAQVIEECDEENNFATRIITVSDSIVSTDRAYRYWFDDQFAQAVSVTHALGDTFVLNDSIPTTALSDGLHTFHIAFKDTSDKWSSTISSMFVKVNSSYPSGSPRYEYWFDQNYNSRIVKTVNNTSNLMVVRDLNTGSLNPGLHTFAIRLKPDGRHWSSTVSSLFYKLGQPPPAGPAQYEYWFDQDYASRTNLSMTPTSNFFLLDSLGTDSIASGLHTFNVRFKPDGGHWSSSVSSLFYKISTAHPEGDAQYEYWFDGNYDDRISLEIGSTNNLMILDSIETGDLSNGLHTVHVRSKPDGSHWSSVTSDLFYKTHESAGDIIKYQYWFDSNVGDSVTVMIPATENLLLNAHIDSMGIPRGLHTFHIRHQQSAGIWSSVTSDLFYKNDPHIINNRIVRFVYWYDGDWQNSQTIFLPGLPNDSLTIYINAEDLSLGEHTVSMFFRDVGEKWSSIVGDTFNKVDPAIICPFNDKEFTTGIFVDEGATFQWQVDTGTGWLNLTDDAVYSGATDDTLHLTNAPTTWYGNQYRCQITDEYGTVNSQTYTLRFSLTWDGSESTAWEDPDNWSCMVIPDGYTDVFVNTGVSNYPEVTSNVECRKLDLRPGAAVLVNAGWELNVTGNE